MLRSGKLRKTLQKRLQMRDNIFPPSIPLERYWVVILFYINPYFLLVYSSENFLFLPMWNRRSPPDSRSITRKRLSLSWNADTIFTMNLCVIRVEEYVNYGVFFSKNIWKKRHDNMYNFIVYGCFKVLRRYRSFITELTLFFVMTLLKKFKKEN